MKGIVILLAGLTSSLLIQSNLLQAQNIELLEVNALICGDSKSYFNLNDLIHCSEISAQDTNLQILSFLVSGSTEGMLREIHVEGNSFSEKVINYLITKKPHMIYVEKIQVSDSAYLIPKKVYLNYTN